MLVVRRKRDGGRRDTELIIALTHSESVVHRPEIIPIDDLGPAANHRKSLLQYVGRAVRDAPRGTPADQVSTERYVAQLGSTAHACGHVGPLTSRVLAEPVLSAVVNMSISSASQSVSPSVSLSVSQSVRQSVRQSVSQ